MYSVCLYHELQFPKNHVVSSSIERRLHDVDDSRYEMFNSISKQTNTTPTVVRVILTILGPFVL